MEIRGWGSASFAAPISGREAEKIGNLFAADGEIMGRLFSKIKKPDLRGAIPEERWRASPVDFGSWYSQHT